MDRLHRATLIPVFPKSFKHSRVHAECWEHLGLIVPVDALRAQEEAQNSALSQGQEPLPKTGARRGLGKR